LDSFYRWNLTSNEWTEINPSGPSPFRRYLSACAATPDGLFYMFGGDIGTSEELLSVHFKPDIPAPSRCYLTGRAATPGGFGR
jgi:hypothetical protein